MKEEVALLRVSGIHMHMPLDATQLTAHRDSTPDGHMLHQYMCDVTRWQIAQNERAVSACVAVYTYSLTVHP